MSEIKRFDINEEYALSGMVEAGDYVFLNFCVGNVGQSFEAQVNGALDDMEKVFKERFKGNYPARKTIETNFAHIGGAEGLHIQMDAIAYKK